MLIITDTVMVSGEFGQINPINELMNMKPKLPFSLGALFQQPLIDPLIVNQ